MTQKKIIEVCYSNSMKINRGQYEQEAPFYSAKSIIEENGQVIDETAEYARLRGIIDPLLIAQYKEAKVDMSGVRIRVKDGKKYPSVTSIINPDPLPESVTSKEYGKVQMEKYSDRGTEYHRLINHFLTKKEWLEPEGDISPLKFDIDVKGFFTEFGSRIESKKLNEELFNERFMFSGEADCLGMVDGKRSIIDWKTGSWKLEQLVSYSKCVQKIEQLVIGDLKNKKLICFDVNSPESIEAFENFLMLRGSFKARFGV